MIRISNVDYINTLPIKIAFENSDFIKKNAVVTGANPTGCVKDLLNDKSDLGLVPVKATIDELKNFDIIGFGIASYKKVDSVLLLSEQKRENLSNIFLDYQSKSSNEFIKILAHNYWKSDINFINSDVGYENKISNNTGGLVIGDRALKLKNKFKYSYDIAEEWYRFTNMPAVFAVWVSNGNASKQFIESFKKVLETAVNKKLEIAQKYAPKYSYFDLIDYLNNKIYYKIGAKEQESIELYRQLSVNLKI